MKPTEELVQEHDAILRMLRVLDGVCTKLSAGEKINAGDLEKMIEFFRVFADRCHHAKEETALFPALEAAGIPREHGPIGVMLAEHTAGRKYVQDMLSALQGYRKNAADAVGDFVSSARAYINLLTAHIAKENQVLFPMADRHLSAKAQEDLAGAFERLEREQIGEGTHERLHATLHELEQSYLVAQRV